MPTTKIRIRSWVRGSDADVRSGQRHAIVRPVDDAARRAIEAEILGQLGQREDAAAEVEGHR